MEINKPITTIIILIVNLVLIFLFVIPKYQESGEIQINFEKKQIDYNNQSKYQAELLSILKNIEERKEIIEKIDIALPSNFSISPIVNFLQEKAKENQLSIKSMVFSKIASQTDEQLLKENSLKKVKSVNITVNLSGSYQGLKNLLISLDRSVRLFEVDSISFSSPEIFVNSNGSTSSNQLRTYDFRLEVKTNTY